MYIVGLNAKGAMRKPVTLEPHKTLLDARNTLLKYNISRVIISKDHKALGIVTEKDIARFIYSEVPSRKLDEIHLDEVMSRNLVSVEEETDLRTCARVMLEKQISSLIAVNSKSRDLRGIFTKTDLTNAYVDYFSLEHKVQEFMTKEVLTVAPEEPIHSAIMLMSGNEISRVVVVKENHPVGIVTGRDLLPASALFGRDYFQKGSAKAKEYPFIPAGIKSALLVSDVMTPDPLTTTVNSDLADAAYLMIRNRISGLPVVNSACVLQGIVTRTDVVRALAAYG